MRCGIYKIVSKAKDQFYLGSSVRIEVRWKQHLSDLKNNRHHSQKLQRVYNKYGESDLSFEMVEECSIEEIKVIEQRYLDSLDFTQCLNMSLSASGGDNISHHPNKAEFIKTRQIKVKRTRELMGEEQRKKKYGHPGSTNSHWKGGVVESQSICKCGKKKSIGAQVCIKCTAGKTGTMLGKTHSEEVRKKICKRRAERIDCLPKTSKPVEINGVSFLSSAKAAKELGVHSATIANRIKANQIGYKYL